MKRSAVLFLLTFLVLAACKQDKAGQDKMQYHGGTADLSCFIAIGNSLTAGYANNSLYRSGQENSYPNILARQFAKAGGGNFVQPLLPGEAGWPGKRLILGKRTDCTGAHFDAPVNYSDADDTQGSSDNVAAEGPFNNLGIPGVRCVDFSIGGYVALNYYAKRMFSQTNKPLMELVPQSRATFFSLWLGSNDVLGYATGGGTGTVSGMALDDISPLAYFAANYDTLVNRLTANGAKGILITIPDITMIPFFTTIQPEGLQLDQQQANVLNQYYRGTGIVFAEGANYYVIADDEAPGGKRKMRSGEYLLLTVPLDSLTCGTWGKTTPIPDEYVLTATEIANIENAVTGFNQVISAAATRHHLALMDATAYLQAIANGLERNGLHFDSRFMTGGVFSLDGIHLTPRGYALLANRMIQTINAFYHGEIPEADVAGYPEGF
ncbi:MAG TPA: SGNH/GDSL hydrolase family protein [Edaphocola sp.]|nr:SGNH/GDSL hydrolase family protein [Edaphocola sp.]